MKIILTHEVTGLGAAGDVVEVKDGYARNYLVPRGFAIRWTKGGEKDVAQIRRARKIHEIATIEQANEIKARLEGVKVRLAVRSGDSRPPLRLRHPRRPRLGDQVGRAARTSTSAASNSDRRSRPWARTRSPSGCTPRSPRSSASRSSPRNAALDRAQERAASHPGMRPSRRSTRCFT